MGLCLCASKDDEYHFGVAVGMKTWARPGQRDREHNSMSWKCMSKLRAAEATKSTHTKEQINVIAKAMLRLFQLAKLLVMSKVLM